MAKRILINKKAIEPLELVFEDGTKKYALINAQAIVHLNQRNADIEDLAMRPWEYASEILYCGMYEYDRKSTIDEAKAIVMSSGAEVINALYDCVMEVFNVMADDEAKEQFAVDLGKIEDKLKKDRFLN